MVRFKFLRVPLTMLLALHPVLPFDNLLEMADSVIIGSYWGDGESEVLTDYDSYKNLFDPETDNGSGIVCT